MVEKSLRLTPNLLAGMALMVLLALGLGWLAPAMAQSGDEALEEGAQLYAENCLVCHGDQGQGRVGATLAKNWPSIRPDLTIRAVIADGVPGSPMPAWSQAQGGLFSDSQIDALVAYILSWETGEPFKYVPASTPTARPTLIAPPEVTGNPNRGGVLFDENCSVCHGANGEGRIGATLARSWSGVRPELEIRTIIANGVGGSTMPAWSQTNGGPLSDQDIADLTAFVLALTHTMNAVGMPTPAALPEANSLSGWGGLVVTIVLFGLLVGVILFAQRKKA
jgi:mono/diheme cytochrome c family protein